VSGSYGGFSASASGGKSSGSKNEEVEVIKAKKIFTIVNVLCDRRLCLKDDGEEEKRTCSVTVSTSEEYDLYEKLIGIDLSKKNFLQRHQRYIIP